MQGGAVMLELDRIICGDCLEVLKTLPAESVDCCITSPPYYGLRSYLPDGHPDKKLEIGLDPTPEAYVNRLVEVFREVKRVLKPEGTLWLNLGDSYAGSWGNSGHRPEIDGTPSHQREKKSEYLPRGGWDQRRDVPPNQKVAGCKPKDLIGIPWMVAFALRADGWYLRSDIIWQKPNCMPESVTDRPTKSHEYLFLLSKNQKYYYDDEAIKEKSVDPPGSSRGGSLARSGNDDFVSANNHKGGPSLSNGKRNKRTVWTIPTKPFKEAHFATFPEALVEPCILAGTSESGYCPECGKPWMRQVENNGRLIKDRNVDSFASEQQISKGKSRAGTYVPDTKTIGWLPSCQCASKPRHGIVLDPFSGAGTVALVAKKLGRHYIGIELNPDYISMAKTRVQKTPVNLRSFEEDARP
jgi:DNA modification methylase